MTISTEMHDALCDSILFSIGLYLGAILLGYLASKLIKTIRSPYHRAVVHLNAEYARSLIRSRRIRTEQKRDRRRYEAALRFVNEREPFPEYRIRTR